MILISSLLINVSSIKMQYFEFLGVSIAKNVPLKNMNIQYQS
jgi:hypothetical protein